MLGPATGTALEAHWLARPPSLTHRRWTRLLRRVFPLPGMRSLPRLMPSLLQWTVAKRLPPDPQIIHFRWCLMLNILRLGLAAHNVQPPSHGPLTAQACTRTTTRC